MAKHANKSAATSSSSAAPASTPVVETQVKAAKAPRQPKAPKASADATVAVVVAADAAAAAAPAKTAVAAKAPRQPKAPKASAAPAAAAPTENTVIATPSEVVAAAAEVVSVSTEFTDFMARLQQLGATISSLKTEFRSLEKKATRELKTAAKASHKRKRKTGNRSPSGFVKPTLISDELASFLGKTKGTEMARTEVTREINAYIRANQLQDKTNGRRINADSKLSSLLKLASGEELTYFNLQRYMSPHFAKTAAPVATA